MRKRKYKLNENYFGKIDSEDKAYFLGWMYSDGNIHKRKGNSYSISLGVQEKDKYILDIFKKCLDSEHPIKILTMESINKNNHTHIKASQNHYKFTIVSYKLGNDLVNLGCFPNKSLTLKFPTKNQVPENLIPYFIRGLLDGDGTVFTSNRHGQVCINFLGTYDICDNIRQFLFKRLNLPLTSIVSKNKIFKLVYRNGPKLLDFYKLIYNNPELCLERKRTHFDSLINNPPEPKTSKYIGVHWCNKLQKWIAKKQINKKKYHIGVFNDPIDAKFAYDNFVPN